MNTKIKYITLVVGLIFFQFAPAIGKNTITSNVPKTNNDDKPTPEKNVMVANKLTSSKLNVALGKLVNKELNMFQRVSKTQAPKGYAIQTLESQAKVDTAKAWFATLQNSNRVFDKSVLTSGSQIQLPLAVSLDLNQTKTAKVEVALVRGSFYPTYASLQAYLKVDFPTKDGPKTLFFGADSLQFSYDGGFLNGTLYLLEDVEIPMGKAATLVIRGGFNKSTGTFEKLTYGKFGCEEFQGFGLSGEVIFSDGLVPISPETGQVIAGLNLRTQFQVFCKHFQDLLIGISLPAFAVKSYPKVGFIVDDATLDMSDYDNPNGIKFPETISKNFPDGNEKAWRGVYVREFSMLLPREIKKTNDKSIQKAKPAFGIGIQEAFIDEYGFTGTPFARNIIPLEEGSASGWQMSLDYFGVKFEANQLIGGSFNGKMRLPLSKKLQDSTQSILRYTAIMQKKGDYIMSLKTENELDFAVMRAKCTLTKNSSIIMTVKDDRFRPVAHLSGTLNIFTNKKGEDLSSPDKTAPKDSADTKFEGVVFQDLILQTEAPYFRAKYFGYKNESQIGAFPVQINEFSLRTSPDGSNVAIGMDMDLNLMDGDAGLKAGGGFSLAFKREENGDEDASEWKFDKIRIESLRASGTVGIFKFDGAIYRYGLTEPDPAFGKGFEGCIGLEITDSKFKGTKFNLVAQFGAKEGIKYWRGEILAKLPDGEGIPIGPLKINGMGAALYHHMKPRLNEVESQTVTHCPSPLNNVAYQVNNNIKIGFKAVVFLTAGANSETQILDGSAGFEIVINNNWGINSIGIFGDGRLQPPTITQTELLGKITNKCGKLFQYANIATGGEFSKSLDPAVLRDKNKKELGFDPNKLPKDSNSLTFDINLLMDFEHDVFHGTANVYAQIPTAGIYGNGPNGRAGYMVIHADKNTWYIHLGTPQEPIGLQMQIGPILARAGAYFMIGKELPIAGPPPAKVLEIVGLNARTYNSKRDPAALANASGVAFGANFEAMWNTDVANLYLGVGFDLMMARIAADCGLNHWYLDGQIYAAVMGSFGVKVGKKNINIGSMSFGALMAFQGPRPMHLYGKVNVQVRVLVIKVNVPLEFEAGKACGI